MNQLSCYKKIFISSKVLSTTLYILGINGIKGTFNRILWSWVKLSLTLRNIYFFYINIPVSMDLSEWLCENVVGVFQTNRNSRLPCGGHSSSRLSWTKPSSASRAPTAASPPLGWFRHFQPPRCACQHHFVHTEGPLLDLTSNSNGRYTFNFVLSQM